MHAPRRAAPRVAAPRGRLMELAATGVDLLSANGRNGSGFYYRESSRFSPRFLVRVSRSSRGVLSFSFGLEFFRFAGKREKRTVGTPRNPERAEFFSTIRWTTIRRHCYTVTLLFGGEPRYTAINLDDGRSSLTASLAAVAAFKVPAEQSSYNPSPCDPNERALARIPLIQFLG